MPLKKVRKGASKKTISKTISENIHEMVAAGHPVNQAVAAALHTAHPYGKKKTAKKKVGKKRR
jgi:hypothetical protein